MPGTTQTHVTREVIGNIVALRGSRNLMTPNLMISNDATYCTLVVLGMVLVGQP
jgi:hypothetical protein